MKKAVTADTGVGKEKKNQARGERFQRVAEAYWHLVGASSMKEFARRLGQSDGDFYNWRKGHKPGGGERRLAAIYEPLRRFGLDPDALATWVFQEGGALPEPAGGAVVPDVSAPIEPAQPLVRSDSLHSILHGVRAGTISVENAAGALEVLFQAALHAERRVPHEHQPGDRPVLRFPITLVPRTVADGAA